MDIETLVEIGLSAKQAEIYLLLIEKGAKTAPDLQVATGESRTNVYALLERLIELELVVKKIAPRKTTYSAANPLALERLAENKRKQALDYENRVTQAMPRLLNFYFTYSEQPGVRFYQGAKDIATIYEDILRTSQPIKLLRTGSPKEDNLLPFFAEYIKKRIAKGISVDAITSEHPEANKAVEQDKAWLLTRTWLKKGAYSAPVEVNIYGNKVAFVSFGEEIIGMIIESPQIAEAMRQMFELMKLGAEATTKRRLAKPAKIDSPSSTKGDTARGQDSEQPDDLNTAD